MPEKLTKDQMRKVFKALHNPDSPVRQLADWKGGDPANPPPKVKEVLSKLVEASREALKRSRRNPETRKRFAEGD